ncbi:MAG: PDZ domain-containing protein [Phycisphaerae bacterium]|nr:PDZ domain-containing protein [Phycisphaerae bacterium]
MPQLCVTAIVGVLVAWLTVPAITAAAQETPDLGAVLAEEQARVEVIAAASRSVVCILDPGGTAGGSGVIIAPDGYGLTNFHVVAEILKAEGEPGCGALSDGQRYPLEVIGIDPTGDVAMFRLTGRDSFDAAELGDSNLLRVGDSVWAAGNPFMLAEDYTPTVTAGIISGLHRYQYGADARTLVYTDCIQVDASINPGNSGGPLFDAQGRVIGINGRASFQRRGRVNVGLAYAISINQIRRFMPGLRAGLLVEHASLGATVMDSGYRRVVFDRVLANSPAAQAGIRTGDRLIAFADQTVYSANQFGNLLGAFPAAWPVSVVWEHEGQQSSQVIELDRLAVRADPALRKRFPTDEEVTRQAAREMAAPAKAGVDLSGTNPWAEALHRAQRHTVKLYGGRIGTQVGYGTGVIVSPEGEVVTVLSLLLEATHLRAVTHDGHVYRCEVVHRDDRRQLALLKMASRPEDPDTAAPLRTQMQPAVWEPFPVGDAASPAVGDWVLVAGNPFKVADGEEPVSVSRGVIAGRAPLLADRGTQPHPYQGEVLLLDTVTSNPGTPGSAVIDLAGRWVGLVGEVVTSRLTHTDLNYAYPIEEVAAFLRDPRTTNPPAASRSAAEERGPGYHGIRLSSIGYRRQLPFVRSVAEGSPAHQAGVRADDLIISANGVAVPQARVFAEVCDRLAPGDGLSLVIKRGEELISLTMTLTEPQP